MYSYIPLYLYVLYTKNIIGFEEYAKLKKIRDCERTPYRNVICIMKCYFGVISNKIE